ncbi:class I SAM-dependent methyltransferase [Oceanitalea stevensii]|uniref:Class I SAM-dependent methyltransferase n=1 Tax=Oceanitalea stevensii TaxID=2763072 RepID=A0ABR8YYH5_9MICO|nr:class I SAM-dependent methyltransferase [Oceanitalea stevensii]MBD8061095.1 class I SAM-dependent methyltransferase [Oceanitalea stevensii]
MTTADRHECAAALVAAGRPAVVLELGCGNGAALALLVERLPTARLVGVDRSATALTRAAQRLAEPVRSGRVTLLRTAAGGLDLPDGSVDAAFAVDVNLFWTGTATPELATLRRVLRRGGVLHLVVAPPAPNPRVRAGMETALQGAGWTTTAVVERGAVVAVSATPA